MILIEIIVGLLAAYIAFRVFLRLLGGTTVNSVIEQVRRPAPLTPEEILADAEAADQRVSYAESADEAEIAKLTKRTDRYRRQRGK